MAIVFGLVGSLTLVGVGLLIKYAKAYWLISGYNTMSPEKQEKVDVQGLGNFMANMLFVIAGLLALGFALIELELHPWETVAFASLPVVVVYLLIKAQKFDGNTRDSQGNMNVKTKRVLGLVISVILLVVLGIGTMLYFSSRPAEYTIREGVLSISGMYGEDVPIDQITSLQLLNTMPRVTFKANGSALGDMRKGTFTVEGLGRTKVFADEASPPFIYLETEGTPYLLNCASEEMTRILYGELLAEWGKE